MSDIAQAVIKLLIVDDMPETVDSVRKLLMFEPDIQVVGRASDGLSALEAVAATSPDVVLMDVHMPGIGGFEAAEQIRQRWPYVKVVMMSVESDTANLRQAMLSGASEFLIKPFSGDDLASTVRRVFALKSAPPTTSIEAPKVQSGQTPPAKRGQVVAVFGPKAGVGTSFLACNLAVGITEAGKNRVALVDCNLEFGDVGLLLNLNFPKSLVDLAGNTGDVDKDLLDGVMATHKSGLRVLLGPPRPEMAELLSPDAIKDVLRALTETYDLIVVDTLPSFQEHMLAVLDAADLILTVTTLEIPAIKNTKLFLDVASALGYPADKTLLILNRSDSAGGISAADVEKTLGKKIVFSIPSDWRAVIKSINSGEPLVSSERRNKICKMINEVGKFICESLDRSKVAVLPTTARTQTRFGLRRFIGKPKLKAVG